MKCRERLIPSSVYAAADTHRSLCFFKRQKQLSNISQRKDIIMKHIVTLDTRDMAKSAVKGGCGECQTSCQSACKTSCGVANQACENKDAE